MDFLAFHCIMLMVLSGLWECDNVIMCRPFSFTKPLAHFLWKWLLSSQWLVMELSVFYSHWVVLRFSFVMASYRRVCHVPRLGMVSRASHAPIFDQLKDCLKKIPNWACYRSTTFTQIREWHIHVTILDSVIESVDLIDISLLHSYLSWSG